MGVDEYMRLCLTHPTQGYYTTREVFGAAGDFITAPEISQIFGELIGAWLAQCWLQMGAPARVALVECGPGRGTLMRDALRATKAVPGFHAALSVHLVEVSTKLREAQRQALTAFGRPLFWHDDAASLPELPTLLVANEFFDALPIRQYVGAVERRVALDAEGALCFTPEGTVTREDSPESEHAMAQLAALLRCTGGAGLVVDYGYVGGPASFALQTQVIVAPSPLRGEGWGGGGAAGPSVRACSSTPPPPPPLEGGGIHGSSQGRDTFQAVRGHAYVDPLREPGQADLTAHVDFAALARVAQAQSVAAWGPVGQGLFLDRLGGEIRLSQLLRTASPAQGEALISGWRRLIDPRAMGQLFKVLALAPRGWENLAGFDTQPPPMPET